MRLKNINYFIKEGSRGFAVNGLMSVASVFIVVASLLLLGIYIIFSMNLNYIGEQLKSGFSVRAYIELGTAGDRVTQIGEEIKKLDNVNNIEFVSAMDAFNEFKAGYGENASVLDGLENDNPLRDSYKITLKDLSAAEATVAKTAEIGDVAWVSSSKNVMEDILRITAAVRHGSLILMVLLCIVAVFIISNAIRMTLFARRRDIGITKYLGATDWFIRWPFIIEGVITGIVGAFFALVIIIPGYSYIYNALVELIRGEVQLYTSAQISGTVAVWFISIGAVLGAFGSGISIRRYLRV